MSKNDSFSPYDILAKYYDTILGDRSEEVEVLVNLLKPGFKLRLPMGLDLGCGTGEVMKRLLEKRKHLVLDGLDSSVEMIKEANIKLPDCEFYTQNMTDISIGKQYDFVYSIKDSINHVHPSSEWEKVFKSVYDHLRPNGVFVFDVNSPYILRKYADLNTMVFKEKKYEVNISVNSEGENTYRFDVLIVEHNNSNEANVIEQSILESSMDTGELISLLSKYFNQVEAYDEDLNPVNDKTEKMWIRATK